MLDDEFLNRTFDVPERRAIGDALSILYRLKVFTLQRDENALRIAQDFNNGDPHELTERIMQVQQTNRNLLALHELAGTYKEQQR